MWDNGWDLNLLNETQASGCNPNFAIKTQFNRRKPSLAAENLVFQYQAKQAARTQIFWWNSKQLQSVCILQSAKLLFRRNNIIWCKDPLCKSSSVASYQVIYPNEPGDITKAFWEKAIQFHGLLHGLKITNYTLWFFKASSLVSLRATLTKQVSKFWSFFFGVFTAYFTLIKWGKEKLLTWGKDKHGGKGGAIALSYPPRVRVRATVKLSAAFFNESHQ